MRRMLVILALVVAAGMVVQSPALATVYRWVDDQGVVHFSELMPDGVKATVVDVKPSTVSTVSAAEGNAVTYPSQPEGVSIGEAERAERAEKRRVQDENSIQLGVECDEMRHRKALAEMPPRVLVKGDDGEPRLLLDYERDEMLNESKAFLSANCNQGTPD